MDDASTTSGRAAGARTFAAAEPGPVRAGRAQTLSRGIAALRFVAAGDGVGVNEVAAALGVHRTIASRLLRTLADELLVRRDADGRYRGAAGLLELTPAGYGALLDAAIDVLPEIVATVDAPIALIVREGDEAVAIEVVHPHSSRVRLAFAVGSRHPLDRGSAGVAVLAASPARDGEPEAVRRARIDGFSRSHGEVEPGMHGLAVPIDAAVSGVPACLNLIALDAADVGAEPLDRLRAAVARIEAVLRP